MIRFLENHKIISLTLTILTIIEIYYFSSLQGNSVETGIPIAPTIYHFVIFFLFNFFLLTTTSKKQTKTSITLAVFISIFYAILDEIHQIFVPGRSPSTNDVLVDSTGIIFSTIIYLISKKR